MEAKKPRELEEKERLKKAVEAMKRVLKPPHIKSAISLTVAGESFSTS